MIVYELKWMNEWMNLYILLDIKLNRGQLCIKDKTGSSILHCLYPMVFKTSTCRSRVIINRIIKQPMFLVLVNSRSLRTSWIITWFGARLVCTICCTLYPKFRNVGHNYTALSFRFSSVGETYVIISLQLSLWNRIQEQLNYSESIV